MVPVAFTVVGPAKMVASVTFGPKVDPVQTTFVVAVFTAIALTVLATLGWISKVTLPGMLPKVFTPTAGDWMLESPFTATTGPLHVWLVEALPPGVVEV